jgi:hypothetical protein
MASLAGFLTMLGISGVSRYSRVMHEDEIARELANRLKQQAERKFIADKKAVQDAETNRVLAPEMWTRLTRSLERIVGRVNEGLLQSCGEQIECRVQANRITISTTLNPTTPVIVEFIPTTGMITYGVLGKEPNRLTPMINGMQFAYRTEANDATAEEQMARSILDCLR